MQQYEAVAGAIRRGLSADAIKKFKLAAPELAERTLGSLIASCAVLLGAEAPDFGFEWAAQEVDELR